MSRCATRTCSVLVAVALLATGPMLALAEPTEQEVKAALIFNVARCVEWPATAFSSPSAPLVVAIIGQDAVSDALQQMLQQKFIGGHPLEVRLVHTADEARKCHVLYVASSEKGGADKLLQTLHGASTLTVSDINKFAERGGHINLVLKDRHVRVLVNPTNVESSHLKVSSKLLSLAQIVGGS